MEGRLFLYSAGILAGEEIFGVNIGEGRNSNTTG